MGRGSSKAGGGRIMSYAEFMKLNDEAKDNVLLAAVENTVVPDGVKDTPTMRVMVALGMDRRPTMVDDSVLDGMAGEDLFRTIHDEEHYDQGKIIKGMSTSAIVDQFTQGRYTSLSDQNGSSEGRGYYFANDLEGAARWGQRYPSNQTMRAKIDPNAKTFSIDELFAGSKYAIWHDYWDDKHFHRTMEKNRTLRRQPWDAISIWAIKNGYQAARATDSGTGYKELVVFDRGILKISKSMRKTPKGYKSVDYFDTTSARIKWSDMKEVKHPKK